MLRYQLLQPQILQSLASAGHGAKILIADSNYAYSTNANPAADRVYLNLAPGMLTVTDVLRVLVDAVPLEVAEAIHPLDTNDPPIFRDYYDVLSEIEVKKLGRFPFYDAAKASDTTLVIATGEQRIWACILLTIGYIAPEPKTT